MYKAMGLEFHDVKGMVLWVLETSHDPVQLTLARHLAEVLKIDVPVKPTEEPPKQHA